MQTLLSGNNNNRKSACKQPVVACFSLFRPHKKTGDTWWCVQLQPAKLMQSYLSWGSDCLFPNVSFSFLMSVCSHVTFIAYKFDSRYTIIMVVTMMTHVPVTYLMQGKGQNEGRDSRVQITGFVTDHKVDLIKLIRCRQVWLSFDIKGVKTWDEKRDKVSHQSRNGTSGSSGIREPGGSGNREVTQSTPQSLRRFTALTGSLWFTLNLLATYQSIMA
jgi:hypothetical protein